MHSLSYVSFCNLHLHGKSLNSLEVASIWKVTWQKRPRSHSHTYIWYLRDKNAGDSSLYFFLLQLSQTGIIKLSHSNYALTKYNIFRHRWPLPILAILFRPFGLLARKTFYIIWLSNLSILSVPDEGGAFVEQTQMNYWNCPCKTLWVLIYVQRVNFMFSVFWSLLRPVKIEDENENDWNIWG
jgi:hypothetical protein